MNINSKHILLEGKKSINGLEVSHNLGSMNWYDAKIACQKLGLGWRLPTIKEWNMLYKNNEEIGGFSNNSYWSSTEDDYNFAWLFSFYYGAGSDNKETNANYVRAVRSS